jgi:hypothetical protein
VPGGGHERPPWTASITVSLGHSCSPASLPSRTDPRNITIGPHDASQPSESRHIRTWLLPSTSSPRAPHLLPHAHSLSGGRCAGLYGRREGAIREVRQGTHAQESPRFQAQGQFPSGLSPSCYTHMIALDRTASTLIPATTPSRKQACLPRRPSARPSPPPPIFPTPLPSHRRLVRFRSVGRVPRARVEEVWVRVQGRRVWGWGGKTI